MTDKDVTSEIRTFITEEFLHGKQQEPVTDTTPLVESGVLDSLRIAVLLTFIRDRLGIAVPLEKIDARNFADIRTIAAMLDDLAAVDAAAGRNR